MRLTAVASLLATLTIGMLAAGCGPPRPEDPCPSNNCGNSQDTGVDAGPSCKGCLFGSAGNCVAGTEDLACGSGGEVCKECGEDEFCSDQGQCETKPCPEICEGCCYDGECQPGVKDFACGTGGQRCGTCPEDKHCTPQGECVACPDGCWTKKGECREGTSEDACGGGGGDCTTCADGETCKEGTCVEPTGDTCGQSCVGCCAGDQCKKGANVQACGSDGEACQTCPKGFECSATGDCTVSDGSRWDVVAVEATIIESTVDPDTTSAPDPYLKMTVGDSSGKTSVVNNVYRVQWNEVVVETVAARALKGSATYTLWDDDWTGKDKIVSDCSPGFTDEDFANKTVHHTCIGGASSRAKADVVLKLVPN